jgi:hypothetical protein
MISDSARGVALWFLVIAALLYGIVNTLTNAVHVFS